MGTDKIVSQNAGNSPAKGVAMYTGLVPCYGRDYSSKKDILVDWLAGKDFKISDFNSPYCDKPINLQDAETAGLTHFTVRYQKLRKVCTLVKKGEKWVMP